MFTSEVKELKAGDTLKSQLCGRTRDEEATYITLLPASGASSHCSSEMYCHMQAGQFLFPFLTLFERILAAKSGFGCYYHPNNEMKQ